MRSGRKKVLYMWNKDEAKGNLSEKPKRRKKPKGGGRVRRAEVVICRGETAVRRKEIADKAACI